MSGRSDLPLAQGLRPLARDRAVRSTVSVGDNRFKVRISAQPVPKRMKAQPVIQQARLGVLRATFSTAQKRVEIDSTRGIRRAIDIMDPCSL